MKKVYIITFASYSGSDNKLTLNSLVSESLGEAINIYHNWCREAYEYANYCGEFDVRVFGTTLSKNSRTYNVERINSENNSYQETIQLICTEL